MKKMNNKVIAADPTTYITDAGTLTINDATNTISLHDGITPGGLLQLSPAQNTFVQQISLAGTISVTIPNSLNYTVTI